MCDHYQMKKMFSSSYACMQLMNITAMMMKAATKKKKKKKKKKTISHRKVQISFHLSVH